MSDLLFNCQHVSKRFGGVHALMNVGFELRAGSVLGLVGENGAGKSTLINILGGMFAADDGAMLLEGHRYAPRDPATAVARGVRIAHQELNLFPNLSLAENLFLDELPTGSFGIRTRMLEGHSRTLLDRVGLAHDPHTAVARLTIGEQQLLEIAKAIRKGAKLVIFDEPTTSLTHREALRLFDIIDQLRREGTGVIYISHQLEDVLRIADDVLILRDGVRQSVSPASSLDVPAVIRQMVGREAVAEAASFSKTTTRSGFITPLPVPVRDRERGYEMASRKNSATSCSQRRDDVALELRQVTRRGVVENISIQIRQGEVVGLAGMLGAGRTELARLAFGLDPLDDGAILLHGEKLAHPTPARCRNRGAAFVSEDRRREGLLLEASVDDNILLAAWPSFSRAGWLRRRSARRAAESCAEALHISGSRDRPARQLSGGNQQKAVFAKWLLRDPKVLILDEPTRGVDVGAKEEIYHVIRRLTAGGAAILLISSEIEELLGLADRIIVLRAGRMVAEFASGEFDREHILAHALGQLKPS
jgi:ribose transport system ATP-binding protein